MDRTTFEVENPGGVLVERHEVLRHKRTERPGRKPKPVKGALARLMTMYGENLSAVARALCLSRQAVFVWARDGRIPIRYALRVERLTGGLITAMEILREEEGANPPEVVLSDDDRSTLTATEYKRLRRELDAAEQAASERSQS